MTLKFELLDKQFIEKRNTFFAEFGQNAKFAVDNWGLFAGAVPIAKTLAMGELIKKTVTTPGHILEFGVYNGSNLLSMAKILSVFAPNDLKRIYGFDSFEGLTEFTEFDISKDNRNSYKGDEKILHQMIEMHNLSESVFLVKGLIEDTIQTFFNNNKHFVLSLVYIDTDLYQSTKLILDCVWKRLSPGGIIAFDEGYHDRYPGEGQAAIEFFEKIEGKYKAECFPYSRQPMYYIQKA